MVLMKMGMLFQLSRLPKSKKTEKGNTRNTVRMGKEMGEKSQREEEGITKRETKMREEKEEKGIKGIEKKGLNIRDSEDKGKILWLMALSLINRLDKENNIRNPENKGQNIHQ